MLKSIVWGVAVTASLIGPAFRARAQDAGINSGHPAPEVLDPNAKKQLDYAMKRSKDPNMPYGWNKIYGGWGTGSAIVAVESERSRRTRIDWTYNATTAPSVRLYWQTSQDDYLGFNSRGTWILDNGHDQKNLLLLVFNGPNSTMETVAKGATLEEILPFVPKDLQLVSCRVSADCYTEELYGPGVTYPRREEAAKKEALKHKTTPAPNPNAALGTALVNSLPAGMAGGGQGATAGGSGPQSGAVSGANGGATKPIHGANATVTNGVLSFVIDDPQSPENGQRKSYPVTRTGMGAPTASGASAASGLWMAKDESRVIMFAVQTDNRVTGTPLAAGAGAMFAAPSLGPQQPH